MDTTRDRTTSTERLTVWVAIVSGAAVLVGATALVVLAGGPARSWGPPAAAGQPYGGCAEAWQAPRSPGAQRCRELGYAVSARFVLSPRGVVLHSSLPHCRHEDGSGGPRPCTWNVGRPTDGDGGGLAFKVRRDLSVRYVWATRPTTHGWRWVSRPQAQSLARQFTRPADRRSVSAWLRCVIRHGTATWVKCPNGRSYRR